MTLVDFDIDVDIDIQTVKVRNHLCAVETGDVSERGRIGIFYSVQTT